MYIRKSNGPKIEPLCASGINPLSKTPPPLSCQPPLNLQTVKVPLFRQPPPPSILVFGEPPL